MVVIKYALDIFWFLGPRENAYFSVTSVFLLNLESHPWCGFSRRVHPDTQKYQTHFISPHSTISQIKFSHWSEWNSETLWLAERRVLLAIRSRQTSHTKKPQSTANIPLLTSLRMESFQLIRIPQSISWHVTEYKLCDGDQMSILYSQVRKTDDVVMMMLFELHMGKASTHS